MFVCSERLCDAPPPQKYGHRADCPEPFLYDGTCRWECDAGYELPEDGSGEVQCGVESVEVEEGKEGEEEEEVMVMVWSGEPTACVGEHCILTNILHQRNRCSNKESPARFGTPPQYRSATTK